MRRFVIACVVVVVGVALLIGLHPVSSARTFDDYAHKAKDTAESVLSSVQTARLVAQAGSTGDAWGPYVSVALSEAERDVTKAQTVFASVQPPDRHSDAVRARLGSLVRRSATVVGRLRITARRGELSQLARQARPLQRVARRLDRFIQAPGAR